MKLFILTVECAEIEPTGEPFTKSFRVDSAEDAAVQLWSAKQTAGNRVDCRGSLFEVDLDRQKVSVLPIPEIEFRHLAIDTTP